MANSIISMDPAMQEEQDKYLLENPNGGLDAPRSGLPPAPPAPPPLLPVGQQATVETDVAPLPSPTPTQTPTPAPVANVPSIPGVRVGDTASPVLRAAEESAKAQAGVEGDLLRDSEASQQEENQKQMAANLKAKEQWDEAAKDLEMQMSTGMTDSELSAQKKRISAASQLLMEPDDGTPERSAKIKRAQMELADIEATRARKEKSSQEAVKMEDVVGNKTAAIVALVLGGISQGMTGAPNVALDMINKMIDRETAAREGRKTLLAQKLGNAQRQQERLSLRDAVLRDKKMEIADKTLGRMIDSGRYSQEQVAGLMKTRAGLNANRDELRTKVQMSEAEGARQAQEAMAKQAAERQAQESTLSPDLEGTPMKGFDGKVASDKAQERKDLLDLASKLERLQEIRNTPGWRTDEKLRTEMASLHTEAAASYKNSKAKIGQAASVPEIENFMEGAFSLDPFSIDIPYRKRGDYKYAVLLREVAKSLNNPSEYGRGVRVAPEAAKKYKQWEDAPNRLAAQEIKSNTPERR